MGVEVLLSLAHTAGIWTLTVTKLHFLEGSRTGVSPIRGQLFIFPAGNGY